MIRKLAHATFALSLVIGSAACSNTARGVVQEIDAAARPVRSAMTLLAIRRREQRTSLRDLRIRLAAADIRRPQRRDRCADAHCDVGSDRI